MYIIGILLSLALLPGMVLMVYVYKKDKIEKEPAGLLSMLFAFGVLACFPASFIESALDIPIKKYLGEGYAGHFVSAFFGIALVEELCKYIFMRSITWRNHNFNFRFDGIVYAVFVSLGFATIENILYVFRFGFATAVFRALVSVPAHMMFAVFMGIYYGLARHAANHGAPRTAKRASLLALLIPVLVHGFFDFCLFTNNGFLVALFYIFIMALYYISFKNINKYSENDYRIL